VVALVGALVFGAGCWTEGCERLAFYRGERDARVQANGEIKNDVDRARVEALYARWIEAADANRARAVPLAAATFVLGAALLALAGRGIAGRSNARAAIVQVVAAQALVVAASWWILRDVRRTEWDWIVEQATLRWKETTPAVVFDEWVHAYRAFMYAWSPAWLALRSVASALIIFALTRQRSREIFEAAAG
jgi:hypothetical protein